MRATSECERGHAGTSDDNGTVRGTLPLKGTLRGAGGNRTPVRRAGTASATTIPVVRTYGCPSTGLVHRRVFPRCQKSFPVRQWSLPPSTTTSVTGL